MSNLTINGFHRGEGPPHEGEPPDSLYIRVYRVYAQAIGAIVSYFEPGILGYPVIVFATILLEPGSVLRTGCEGLYYLFKSFLTGRYDFSGINPGELNEAQRRIRPILFLHSNFHSPVGCTGIASGLSEYGAPIFTVQLTHGDLHPEDDLRINAKIEEIKALYRASGINDITIDLIGHSRGAWLAERLAVRAEINRIALLGHFSRRDHEKIYEINSQFDSLVLFNEQHRAWAIRRAAARPNFSLMLGSLGHLGLLYSPHVHRAIIGWLRQSPPL